MTPLTSISAPSNYDSQVGLAMLKKVLDMTALENQKIVEMMQNMAVPADPNLGTKFDVTG